MILENSTIVTIDDTSSIRTFLRLSLEGEGALVHQASSANSGLALCKQTMPDIVILDLGLPDRDGLDVLPDILALFPDAPPKVIILTVRKGSDTIAKAEELGAAAYLTKPFMVEDLLEIIEDEL